MFDIPAVLAAFVGTLICIAIDKRTNLFRSSFASLELPPMSYSGRAADWVLDTEIFLHDSLADMRDYFDYLYIPLRPFRLLWRDSVNASIASQGHPSLMKLPDDVLLMILDIITDMDKVPQAYKYPPGPPHEAWSQVTKLSMTNHRMRALSSRRLFKAVTLGQGRHWSQTLRAVDFMTRCTAMTEYTKTLTIDLWTGAAHSSPHLPARLPLALATLLLRLKRLEKLTFVLPIGHTDLFATTFAALQPALALPSVRSLVLGTDTDWLIPMCPNVTSIATHDGRWLHPLDDEMINTFPHMHTARLILHAGKAAKLRHFELRETWYTGLLDQLVLKSLPHLTSLAIPASGGWYGSSLHELLPVLSRFENLQRLVLAAEQNLLLDYASKEVHTAYDWPDDGNDAVLPRQSHGRRGAQERLAATLVFSHCAQLRELWVGDHAQATVALRDPKDGAVREVHWSFGQRAGAHGAVVPDGVFCRSCRGTHAPCIASGRETLPAFCLGESGRAALAAEEGEGERELVGGVRHVYRTTGRSEGGGS